MNDQQEIRRIAGVSMTSVPLDIEANAKKVKAHMARAAEAGAQLVLFPEMCLPSYMPDAHETAMACDSPVLKDIAAEAGRLGLAASVGFFEARNGKKHVAQAFVQNGEIRSIYRKIYSCESGATHGEDFETVDWDGVTVATNICKDLHFPQVAREHAKRGALLILSPAAYRDDPDETYDSDNHNIYLPRARAKENGVFFFMVNACGLPRVGKIHFGNAILVGPNGRVISRVDRSPHAESMLVADIDLSEARNAQARQNIQEDCDRCGLIEKIPPE